MSEPKFTPGPLGSRSVEITKDHHGIGSAHGVVGSDIHIGFAESCANARLWAAAPDMYDALTTLDAYWTETFPDGPDGSREWAGGLGRLSDDTVTLWRSVRSALAKATGAAS